MLREGEEEQVYFREDLTGIATDISQSNFNVRQFKKNHLSKPIRLQTNQSRQARTVSRLFTEPNYKTANDNFRQQITDHSKTMGQNLNKTLKYNQTFIAPLKKHQRNQSKQIAKSADNFKLSKSKKKLFSAQKKQSKLIKYEKEWSRGRVKERCMEEWLNAILIQFCHQEYFDRNITNCALKKLGIDQNSLVAKGFLPQNVARLYRGLFVFGMGFNELIGELANGNMEVTKVIWRIYAIVLQYCSKGGMETVIGQLQRDNTLKVTELSSQIARRQQIIQKNEELNQKKNNQIFRQIKRLREENINLNNQKTVLLEEYSATEQAFSEEVGLRLKFQTKINQIYGLHRELGAKHHKLFGQFSIKVEELRREADKYFESSHKCDEYRQSLLNMKEDLILLRQKEKQERQYLEELVKERIVTMGKNSKLQFQIIELRNTANELKAKEIQWEKQRCNILAMLELRQKSSKQTHTEYQITLQQNNKLYIQLSDQRKVMEEYQREKKNFNSKIISIVSQNSFTKRKLEELQRKFDELEVRYKETINKMQAMVLDEDIRRKSEEALQVYFDASQLSITEMHKINIAHQEQLVFLRKFHKNMENILENKNTIIQTLTEKHQQSSKNAEKVKIQFEELYSKHRILQEQHQANERILAVKLLKIQKQRQQFQRKQTQSESLIARQSIELNSIRNSFEIVATNFKNQKFQRNTLNNSYLQSLQIIQSKNIAERDLNVKISLMEGQITHQKQRYHMLERNMLRVISQYSAYQERLENTMSKQRIIIQKYQNYRHPMLIEDLQAQVHRNINTIDTLKKKVALLQIQLQKQIQGARQLLEKTVHNFRWEANKLAKENQKLMETKKNQLLFQMQQNKALKASLSELEATAETYRKKIHQKSTSQRQQIYKFMLQQKKKHIQKQIQEMEHLQDQLSKSKKQSAQKQYQYEAQIQSMKSTLRQQIEQAIKKEIENQYDLKFRDMQRSMRSEYAKKQLNFKEENEAMIRNMPLDQILRLKDLKAENVLNQIHGLSHRYDDSNEKQMIDRNTFLKKQMQRMGQDTKKRRQMGKILKFAADYYQN